MKLGLGTVQFGLDYGINNRDGKPGPDRIREILTYAQSQGIDLLDTAADYGDSESTIGKLVPDGSFKIVTKLAKDLSVTDSVARSLQQLKRKSVYGILVHHFQQMQDDPSGWGVLSNLRKSSTTKKIGYSLYLPKQLDMLLDSGSDFDLLQVPFNLFDQRFGKYFPLLKKAGVEIHVRSAFMQGLVFADPATLSDFFDPIKGKLRRLGTIAQESRNSIQSLCLNFVAANEYIDRVIVGVDSVENLETNLYAWGNTLSPDVLTNLTALEESNEQMILPYNWKK